MATKTTTMKPSKLRIRAYQVGFGDCFLLTFFYPQAKKVTDKERHVLVDFGSTGMPEGIPAGEQMKKVAKDIEEQCNKKSKKLHIVVASHRHKDHISGFATTKDGKGTGNIIAGLKPALVVQPWTEKPDAVDPKVKAPKKGAKGGKGLVAGGEGVAGAQSLNALHVASLNSMHEISESMLAELRHLTDQKFKKQLGKGVTDQIAFLANDNGLPNRSAVENLAGMGKNVYVHHGTALNLATLLPGVKVHVLGPPTLEQHAEIMKQKSSDRDEFWMLQLQAAARQFWGLQAATGGLIRDFAADETRLFQDAKITHSIPSHARWFIRQLRAMRGSQMLGLVRILDQAMNNTSVILLFEVGGKKLLFPGDAQIENWEYALKRDKKADLPLLKGVNLYKVGHHGSRNATPKTLWDIFENKSQEEGKTQRLKTVISTMPGKHGHKESNTEVPRRSLVSALSSLSEYHTTEYAAKHDQLYVDVEFNFTR